HPARPRPPLTALDRPSSRSCLLDQPLEPRIRPQRIELRRPQPGPEPRPPRLHVLQEGERGRAVAEREERRPREQSLFRGPLLNVSDNVGKGPGESPQTSA